jgi:hypothetical protein
MNALVIATAIFDGSKSTTLPFLLRTLYETSLPLFAIELCPIASEGFCASDTFVISELLPKLKPTVQAELTNSQFKIGATEHLF